MQSKIVNIGNSQGLRIPKAVLEQCNLKTNQAVSLTVEAGRIIVAANENRRMGWEDSFAGASVEADLMASIPLAEAWDE